VPTFARTAAELPGNNAPKPALRASIEAIAVPRHAQKALGLDREGQRSAQQGGVINRARQNRRAYAIDFAFIAKVKSQCNL